MYNVTTFSQSSQGSYRTQLAIGERYEGDFVSRSRKAGVKAAQYSEFRQDLSESTVDPKAKHNIVEKYGRTWKYIYTMFQRDVWVKIPKKYFVIENGQRVERLGYKRFNIEVKSRNVNGFCYETMMVGKALGWDSKKFKVHYFVIIDQTTNEARWIDVKATQEAGLWKFVPSRICHSGYETDDHYEVETSLFRPLSELFEILKSKSDN